MLTNKRSDILVSNLNVHIGVWRHDCRCNPVLSLRPPSIVKAYVRICLAGYIEGTWFCVHLGRMWLIV